MRRATDTRRVVGWAALAGLALLLAATRAAASVVVEPVARLALEGGYDSNVRYDGRGGDQMGRVSPDLGLLLKDHTWTASGSYGADVMTYPSLNPGPTVNQRGRFDLASRLSPRTRLHLDFQATYAPDPVGLARLGIVGRTGSALVLRGDARLAWRYTPRWTLAGTFSERGANLSDGGGSLLHATGVEAAYALDPRTEVGVAYRFDVFQSLTSGFPSAFAHEAKGVARWRWSRRLTVEAEAGPTLWDGEGGPSLVPEAGVRLLAEGREGLLRVEARHGLGISALSRASLADALELGFVWNLARSFRLRGDGGLWRGGQLPAGNSTNLGYGLGAEIVWLATRSLEMGLGASRFARVDEPSAATERNVMGLRVAWQLRNR
ncbi:MAG: hypothetical protein ACJ79R_21665 [Anaeromyxobacteraceae bacterium]